MISVKNPNVKIVSGNVRINMSGRRTEFKSPSISAATNTVCMLSMLTPAITCITTSSAIILMNHFIRNFIISAVSSFHSISLDHINGQYDSLPLAKTEIMWHTYSRHIEGDGNDSESHQAYHLQNDLQKFGGLFCLWGGRFISSVIGIGSIGECVTLGHFACSCIPF